MLNSIKVYHSINHDSLAMRVVSPGGEVMVTGMWMEVLFMTLVEFRWLSASSCFSSGVRAPSDGCRGLEARPSSSACLSQRRQGWIMSRIAFVPFFSPGQPDHNLQETHVKLRSD